MTTAAYSMSWLRPMHEQFSDQRCSPSRSQCRAGRAGGSRSAASDNRVKQQGHIVDFVQWVTGLLSYVLTEKTCSNGRRSRNTYDPVSWEHAPRAVFVVSKDANLTRFVIFSDSST